jgi:hypothetical protein
MGRREALLKQQEIALQELGHRIADEQRGAYARVIQDPALLAVLIPTGLLGILTLVFQALFGGLY